MKNKKGISKSKKDNIRVTKLKKRGKIGKSAKKQRQKFQKEEKKRTYHAHMQQTIEDKKKREEYDEPEITAEEMLEMVADEDLSTFGSAAVKRIKDYTNIEDIERMPRTFDNDEINLGGGKALKPMLPVLTDDGWADKKAVVSTEGPKALLLTEYTRPEGLKKKKKRRKNKKKEDGDADKDSGISADENGDNAELETTENDYQEEPDDEIGAKPVVEIMAQRQRSLKEMKIKMAHLASTIIEDPSRAGSLRTLLDMLNTFRSSKSETTALRYLLFTLLQVFHDLIPGYRVQENMLNHRLKKNNLAIAKQELNFLSFYRQYLQALEDILDEFKKASNDVGLNALSETVLYCLGDLLVIHPRFNYAVNIIQAIVPYLSHSKGELRTLALDPLFQTIQNDKSCLLTVEIVKRVYQLVRRLRFKVKPEVLRVFFALRVKEMKNSDLVLEEKNSSNKELSTKERLIKKLADKAAVKPSRKKQKEIKKMAKLREEMADINTKAILDTQNKAHSVIIQQVFGIYFHILKNSPHSKLMPIVLEGLSKFAHLINIEFFSDLLSILHKFLEESTLGRKESLFCIQTVFTILSGQGESLNVDPQRFYNRFYAILGEFTTEEKEKNIESILKVVEQMLLMRRKKVSSCKVLSFTKRLATMVLTFSHQSAIPSLVILKKLCTAFSATEALLDPDPDGSSGMFIPDIPDPEHANPAATALWDLVLCRHHYHPSVKILSSNILSGVIAREVPAVFSLTQKTTERLLSDYDLSKLKFHPSIPFPDAHLITKKKVVKRGIQDVSLDLDNLRLQALCEQYLAPEESSLKQNPPKKMQKVGVLQNNFYDSFMQNNVDESCGKKYGSLEVQQVQNFTSYYIGRK